MYEEIIKEKILPEDFPRTEEYNSFYRIEKDIISTLSENQFTISQTRYLFNNILKQFEREMPVTNHTK
jgi:hypothetical protein